MTGPTLWRRWRVESFKNSQQRSWDGVVWVDGAGYCLQSSYRTQVKNSVKNTLETQCFFFVRRNLWPSVMLESQFLFLADVKGPKRSFWSWGYLTSLHNRQLRRLRSYPPRFQAHLSWTHQESSWTHQELVVRNRDIYVGGIVEIQTGLVDCSSWSSCWWWR